MKQRSAIRASFALACLCLAPGAPAAAGARQDGPVARAVEAAWPDRGPKLATEDGAFSLRPIAFVRPMLAVSVDPDAEEPLAGSGFLLDKARLGLRARVFDLAKLKADVDFAGGDAALVDCYADLDPTDGAVVIRAGRFRPWLGRQRLTSPVRQQLGRPAAAWTDRDLGLHLARDLGAGLHGLLVGGLEYAIGVWNGEQSHSLESEVAGAADNIDFLAGGRLAVHPLALAGAGEPLPIGEESDLDRDASPALSIGAAAMFERRHDRLAAVPGVADPVVYGDEQLELGGELALHYGGLAITAEAFYLRTRLADDTHPAIAGAVRDAADGAGVSGDGVGVYAQAGYMLIARTLEVAARFDLVDEDADADGVRLFPAAGITWLLEGRHLTIHALYRARVARGYAADHDLHRVAAAHDIALVLQLLL